jgi:hypothetical protein
LTGTATAKVIFILDFLKWATVATGCNDGELREGEAGQHPLSMPAMQYVRPLPSASVHAHNFVVMRKGEGESGSEKARARRESVITRAIAYESARHP